MTRILEWALLALAAVGRWAAIQQARQVSDLPRFRSLVIPWRILRAFGGVNASLEEFGPDLR
jgi:hypothetical protein